MARRPAAALLVLVAALLLVVGLPLQHLHGALRPAAFSDHAQAVLDDPVVRPALADAAVDAVVAAVERLQPAAGPTARRVVQPRADRVVAGAAFARAWRATARSGLRQVLDGDRTQVRFTVADVERVTTETTGPLPAGLDALVRRAGAVPIFGFERSSRTASATAAVERASALGLPMLVAAGLVLVAALGISSSRRSTVAAAGLAALGVGVFLLVAERIARALALSGADPGRGREIAAVVWDELAGGLRPGALALVVAGALVALGAALARPRRPPGRPAYPLG